MNFGRPMFLLFGYDWPEKEALGDADTARLQHAVTMKHLADRTVPGTGGYCGPFPSQSDTTRAVYGPRCYLDRGMTQTNCRAAECRAGVSVLDTTTRHSYAACGSYAPRQPESDHRRG